MSCYPNTLVAVMAHSKANATLQRHWSYYTRGGSSVLVVGREDTHVWYPEQDPLCIGRLNIGLESYASGMNHLDRLVVLLQKFLQDPKFAGFSDICVIEYDGIFLDKLPVHPGGLCTTFAGYRSPGFHGRNFYHTPWWVDRGTAAWIIEYGYRMIAANLWEQGFLDRWLGLMVDLYHIPVASAPAFSVNSLDRPEFMEAARKAVKAGAVYVHGVKTPEQLYALLKQ